jgi:hypothetical protein
MPGRQYSRSILRALAGVSKANETVADGVECLGWI